MEKPLVSSAAAIEAATAVLDRHFEALNAGDAAAVADTLHFPHYRLAGVTMQVWEGPENYLADFHARAGDGWHHSQWDFHEAFAAGADKVHFDVRFTRYRADNSVLGCYRSLWIVSRIGGRWAAQLRSTFAA
jgi:hypothetical protein